MRKFLMELWRDESGISSVEYALLLAFVATGIIVAASELADAVSGEMTAAAECIEGDGTVETCPGIDNPDIVDPDIGN